MKRFFVCFVASMLVAVCFAQLKVAMSHTEQQEIAKQQRNAKIDSTITAKRKLSYDSMEAYPQKDAVYGMVGQRVMVKPYKEGGGERYESIKFFTSPSIVEVYEPRTKNLYKNEFDYNFKHQSTKYSSVSGRIFTITRVLDYDETKVQGLSNEKKRILNLRDSAYNATRSIENTYQHEQTKDSLAKLFYDLNKKYHNMIIPELTLKDNYAFIELVDKDTIYYMFDKKTDYPVFPFNIEGYITKLTETKKKEKYAKCINMDDYTDTDFYTGKTIRFSVGQIWQLKEIVINPQNGDLVELYTNSKGEVYEAPRFTFDVAFKTKKESDRIKKKYGETIWKAIMTFTIYKGMSKSAVRESWGEPKYINDASYGEQWVYDDKYVYFKNGRVTGWN